MKIEDMTIADALDALENGTVTAVQLLQVCLGNIADKDGEIGAFLEVWDDDAMAQAQAVDEKRSQGEPVGLLAGIPVAIKDNILWKGHHATGASKILEPYVASYSATVVERLVAQDAVLIGRTNCDEFACGGSTEHSAYQKTTNPHDTDRVPGGSSGGSASAVASGMCLGALGSDTGGSIRQPASFCGVVGLKPTYGRVSRHGLMAMASSLDQIGPFGKNVDDCARLLQVIEGGDGFDATCVDHPPTMFESKAHNEDVKDLSNITIGVPKEFFVDGMDPEVEKLVKKNIDELGFLGATIKEISLPQTAHALATYYVLMPSEVSSNTARYDGVRYGLREGEDLLDMYTQTRTKGFGAEVKRRILLGAFSLSAGYFDAYYKKSVQVREAIRRDFETAFDEVDVIVGPTSPVVAFQLGEKFADPLAMYLSDIYTVSANLAGVPAISVPCGLAHGMPVGLQFITPSFREDRLMHIAQYI